ncbi:conserved phage C-terminal domain-containing protein [Lactobacillus gigeriorum]|uniref:Rep protein n=1 Tax=Lactobacillus gigeriorum DSM 23908 = CRBIP 24.85 TaxID=1423751 RepID=I7K0Q5_9LACO|nr:conserved phage C-terminal domain-containing protein [Lactobacillus gigeriorum]CCI87000.1 Rep protein [Lactobacillus gigeriorum DSM 23908 = CRBIP 24.85]
MVRLIKKYNNYYTNISNNLVQDSSLSWKARGIFIYLWSQANEWQFYVSEIAKHSTDGERALRSGLKELEEKGYLKRVHRQSNDGSFDGMDWILSDDPNINHHSQNAIDGEKAENEPKMLQNASDAKRIGCETHSMQKGGLININNNNYQYKKISKIINEKNYDKENIPYEEIVDYLNLKTGRFNDPIHKFRSTANLSRKLIKDLWQKGSRLDDFKTVIDIKCSHWLGTDKEYLLIPATLFDPTNFEKYLHQKLWYRSGSIPKRNKKETATDWSKKQPTYDPNVDLEQIFDDLDDRDEKNA